MAFIEDQNLDRWHLYGLPDESSPEPIDEHYFTMLINEMAGGYRDIRRIGDTDGLRAWKLTFPTLAGGDLLPTIDGVATSLVPEVTREQYIRDLHRYNKVDGYPFAYEWEGAYYLVDIAEDTLSMVKTKGVEIYSTSLTFVQRRLPGVILPTP